MLKIVLDYISAPKVDHMYAMSIVLAIGVINICRGSAFNAMFVVGTHTGKSSVERILYCSLIPP